MTPKKMNTLLKVSLVLLVLLSGVGLFFANQKLTSVARETARLKAEINISEKQAEVYQKTKEQVETLSYVGDLASKVLPEQTDQSVVIAELSQFALRSRLSVAQIAFPEVTTTKKSSKSKTKDGLVTPKGVAVVPISVQFKEGTRYENVLTFLETIESNRRKIQVTNVAFTPAEEDRTVFKSVTIAMNLYTRSGETE